MENDFVREDGQWPPESVPTARDWALFDRAQATGLHLAGGTFVPSSPIVIGGAGLKLSGNQHLVSGDVGTASGGRLALGDDDYPEFADGVRARSIVVPFGVGLRAPPDVLSATEMSLDPRGLRFAVNDSDQVHWFIPPEFLHNGATLDGVTLRFRIGQPHGALPSQLPAFEIFRVAVGHAVAGVVFMTSLPALIANVGIRPAPTTADGYYAGGAVQSMWLPCDAANVIDVSAYSYLIALSDEGGTGSLPGNIYHSLELHFTNITDLRPE